MKGMCQANIKPLGITATGKDCLRSGSVAATPLIGNVEHASREAQLRARNMSAKKLTLHCELCKTTHAS
jgi:hypothetical protein